MLTHFEDPNEPDKLCNVPRLVNLDMYDVKRVMPVEGIGHGCLKAADP